MLHKRSGVAGLLGVLGFALVFAVALPAEASMRDPTKIEVRDAEQDLLKRSIFGYTNTWSARAGDVVEFKVSNYRPGPYDAQLVRLLHRDGVTPETSFATEALNAPLNGSYDGKEQIIHPGSYVHIDDARVLDRVGSFTLVAAVFPTLLPTEMRKPWSGIQHIVGRWNEPTGTGWSLAVDEKGHLTFLVGRGEGDIERVTIEKPLWLRKWVRVSVTYDADTGEVTLVQMPAPLAPGEKFAFQTLNAAGGVGDLPQQGPLRFGAAVGGPGNGILPRPAGAFNGKLDKVRIARGVLSDVDSRALSAMNKPGRPLSRRSIIGFWDFAEGIGTTRVHDLSRNDLEGVAVNIPGRAVKGVEWRGEQINWQIVPDEYSAIYFHEDDLYDAEWSTDFTYTIPQDLQSGVYAVRVRSDVGEDYMPFFVLAPRDQPRAKTALLMPTATYLAYTNSTNHIYPVGRATVEDTDGKDVVIDEWFTVIQGGDLSYKAFFDAHPEYPGGVYRQHTDGTPVRHASILYPSYTIRPNIANAWLSADLGFIGWLEHEGIAYDLITDEVLHAEGIDLLKGYDVVMTGSHPEYVSRNQLEAIETYMEQGGRFMYLGGNGFFPVTAYHQELPNVIEVRHLSSPFLAPDMSESYYAFDGQLGLTWETGGLGANEIFGVGFVLPLVLNGSGHYRLAPDARASRASFVTDGIDGDIVGDFGKQGGGAAGAEVDAANYLRGTPPHALIIASSEGMTWPYDSSPLGAVTKRYQGNYPPPRADIVFFETPNGGAVFSVGSMTWLGSLDHNGFDNNVAQMTENVLRRFLDPKPFAANGEAQ